jgi:hypothetical protein
MSVWDHAEVTSTPHPGTREYRRDTVRITDLVVTDDFIEDVRFENCQIIGPAVLAPLQGCTFYACEFDSQGPDELFWIIPPERSSFIGAIGLLRVEFYACRFQRIGLAVPKIMVEEFRSGFGLEQ